MFWKHLILHNRRWTTLPPYIALPLLCGKAKNKLSCPKNLTIILIHNYETESILEKSLHYVGIDNHVLLKPENGQWPGNTLDLGQADVLADHALGKSAGTSNALVTKTGFVFEAQDLGDLSHGNPRSRHPLFLVEKGSGMRD